MKKAKMIQILILVVALAILVTAGWNPLLGEDAKLATAAKLQETFGVLLGGTNGMFTISNLITAAAIIVLMWLVCIVICAILDLMAVKGKHSRSMAGLFTSLTKFICTIVAGVWALSTLGVNLAGIFASLGIASLIIGFGAQSLIEDAITGIFIIFEDQYNVGDIIVLDDFRGVVRSIGIRTTAIEDGGGNVKIVNNSDIRNMVNRSRNTSIAVCDLSVSYDADLEEIESKLLPELPKLHVKYPNLFLKPPRYMGVEELGESSVVMRFVADVTEENYFLGYRTLRREMKILCDKQGVEIPFNQIVVHQAKN